ncbi:MAG: hypothetical protein FJY43_02820 [Betaproteobacteria bacterium]|nr:hypothetical protein [Betaproteobacteria bacterium]
MTPAQRLVHLITPDRSRWLPMLGCLGIAGACIQAVMFLKPAEPLMSLLVIGALMSWFIGALAAIGYVRWFFSREFARGKQESGDANRNRM